MSNIVPFRKPEPAKLSRHEFKEIVIDMVAKGHVRVSTHLYRDHPERGITQAMIERCLERGTVQTDPYRNKFGNFQADVFRHMAGEQLTVVVAIEWEMQVVVVTAF
jgi:hypothetical protein